VPSKTCKNKINAVVKVRNNGNNTVTGMTIKYRVNNGDLSTVTWNGTLASMKKVNISLPEYEFNILTNNDLVVYSVSPNNLADDYPKNDTLHFPIAASAVTTNAIRLVLRTDNSPLETSWDVKNSLGTIIESSPVYTINNKLYFDTIYLPQADCYTFTIYDSGNNGICCSNGAGVYEISSNGVVIRQGGQFASEEASEFLMPAPVGDADQTGQLSLQIYPIPVTGSARVNINLPSSGTAILNLMTALGQPVWSKNLGWLHEGSHVEQFESGSLKAGIYLLQVKTENGIITRKISILN
jgi:hypothetical protein